MPPEFCPLHLCVFCVVPGIEPLCENNANWKSLLIHDCSLSIFPVRGKRGREKWIGETAKETESSLEWVRGKFWRLLPASLSQQRDKKRINVCPNTPQTLNTKETFVLLPFSIRALIWFGLVLSSFSCSTGETPEYLAELQAQAESDT